MSWAQARIQHFAVGWATAERGPEARGPEAISPKVRPINNQKVCGFGSLFLVGARSHFYSLIFTV